MKLKAKIFVKIWSRLVRKKMKVQHIFSLLVLILLTHLKFDLWP